MTAVSRATLQASADVVKTETAANANTANRVGSVMRDTADSVVFPGDAALSTGSSAERGWVSYQFSSDAVPARFIAKKSRVVSGSPDETQNGDAIAEFVARSTGINPPSFDDVGILRFIQDANGGGTSYELQLHDATTLRKVETRTVGRYTTANATTANTLSIPLAANNLVSLFARWKGVDAAGNMVFLEQRAVYRRIASAAPTIWGSVNNVFAIQKDDAACGTPALAVVGNSVVMTVTGKASTTYTWDVELTWRLL